MAKTSVVLRNEKRKKLVERYGARRAELKRRIEDPALSWEEKTEALKAMAALPRNSSPVRVRNRCQVSGRGRGVYSRFMLSRILLRQMAHRGHIPGMKKSSW